MQVLGEKQKTPFLAFRGIDDAGRLQQALCAIARAFRPLAGLRQRQIPERHQLEVLVDRVEGAVDAIREENDSLPVRMVVCDGLHEHACVGEVVLRDDGADGDAHLRAGIRSRG